MSKDNGKMSFLMYYNQWEFLDKLSKDQFYNVIKAVFALGWDIDDVPALDPVEDMVFTIFRQAIDAADSAYLERGTQISEARKASGSLGGQKKAANKRAKKEPAGKDDDELANVANVANLANASKPSKDDDELANLANVANASKPSKASIMNMYMVDEYVDGNDKDIYIVQNEPTVTSDDAENDAPRASGDAPHAHPSPASGGKVSPVQPPMEVVDEHFAKLWGLFPNKRGKNQVSERTRRRLMGVSVDEMRQAIDRYTTEVMDSPGRQWLNGSTWFNGRYKDYLGEAYVPQPKVAVGGSGQRYVSREGPRDFSDMEE